MSPEQYLEALCRRHGLPPQEAEPLRPLVQLAWTAGPDLRRRILAQVEGAVARCEGARAPARPTTDGEAGDRRLLELVARVLHRWRLGPA